jgi:hypothetical protein
MRTLRYKHPHIHTYRHTWNNNNNNTHATTLAVTHTQRTSHSAVPRSRSHTHTRRQQHTHRSHCRLATRTALPDRTKPHRSRVRTHIHQCSHTVLGPSSRSSCPSPHTVRHWSSQRPASRDHTRTCQLLCSGCLSDTRDTRLHRTPRPASLRSHNGYP